MDDQKDVSLEADTKQTNIENTEEVKDPSDNLTPDHPRFRDVIAKNHELEGTVSDLKSEITELREQIVNKQGAGEDTDDDERALQLIEKRLADKFASKEEVATDRQAIQFDRLSEKYSGKNGYPKFVPVDVVSYSKKNGYGNNYEAAYRDMHFDAIVKVEAGRSNVEVPTSEKPTGGERQQGSSTLTPEDIAQMSDEEYEKNRSKILSGFKPQ